MPNKPIPNQEWELHELIESLSAEFDRFQDTLHLKSYARGISFGLTTTHFELSVFARYDPGLKKWLFRTALPGESGASTITLDVPPLLRDQIQTHDPGFDTKPDTRPIKELSFNNAEIERLNRLGIFTADNIKKMASSSEMRQAMANMTDIEPNRIAHMLAIPEAWYVLTEKDTITIIGDNLTATSGMNVLLAGQAAEIIKSEPNQLTVRLPEGITAGEVVISCPTGTSRFMRFDRNAQVEAIPLAGQTGLSKQNVNKLKAAGIRTVVDLLKQPVAKLAGTLGVSETDAITIVESMAAEANKQTQQFIA
ncbi:MAG: IPT/TIG domain-containing protein [Dehalococcoidia bacterium]|nr:IPT/TIG domain-containing protein [Dehalococcoidia bacterium]